MLLGRVAVGNDGFKPPTVEPEFDRALGAPGLHCVRRKVGFEARATVLPPDLVAKFAPLAFWRDQSGSSAYRIVAAEAG